MLLSGSFFPFKDFVVSTVRVPVSANVSIRIAAEHGEIEITFRQGYAVLTGAVDAEDIEVRFENAKSSSRD